MKIVDSMTPKGYAGGVNRLLCAIVVVGLVLAALPLAAQPSSIITGGPVLNVATYVSDPSPCIASTIWYNSTSNVYKICPNGSAAQVGTGSGSGTVTTTGSPASPQLAAFSGATSITNAAGHAVALPLDCAAGSASGTAYTCSTSPVFTPADGDAVLFEADVANTGAATLNINASAAAPILKQGGGTALVANDILAGQDVFLIFDGTNWQMQGQIGNGPPVTSVFSRTGAVVATNGDYTPTQVGLGNVTNDAQTKAAVMPNTAPSAGQLPLGNAGNTAYAPQTLSQDCTVTNGGVITCTKTNNVAFGPYATGIPFVANAQTGTYQVLASDFSACKTIPVASGTFTITLVASGTQPSSGQCIWVVNYGSGVVTIARSGQNINGTTTSITLNAASSSVRPTAAQIVSDGTNYFAFVAGMDANTLLGATWASPNAIGGVTPSTGKFTTSTAGTAGTTAGYVDLGEGVLTSAMSAQSTATCTPVTSMTWNIAANKNYSLHCTLPITFAASATIAFCIGGPGTPTSHTINAIGSLGVAGAYNDINLVNSATYGTKTSASGAVGASTQIVLVDAVIRNGATASGTALTLQTAGNGTNTFTMLADGDCHLLQTN